MDPIKAATCYLITHSILYGWNGELEVKPPNSYSFRVMRQPNWEILPSRMDTIKAASLILFDYDPKPRQVTKALEKMWLPRGTTVRYIQ